MKPDPARVARRFLEAGRYTTLGNEYVDKFVRGAPDGTELIRALDALGDAIRRRDWDEEFPHLNPEQREQMRQHYGRAGALLMASANELRQNIRNVRKRVKRREDQG